MHPGESRSRLTAFRGHLSLSAFYLPLYSARTDGGGGIPLQQRRQPVNACGVSTLVKRTLERTRKPPERSSDRRGEPDDQFRILGMIQVLGGATTCRQLLKRDAGAVCRRIRRSQRKEVRRHSANLGCPAQGSDARETPERERRRSTPACTLVPRRTSRRARRPRFDGDSPPNQVPVAFLLRP